MDIEVLSDVACVEVSVSLDIRSVGLEVSFGISVSVSISVSDDLVGDTYNIPVGVTNGLTVPFGVTNGSTLPVGVTNATVGTSVVLGKDVS